MAKQKEEVETIEGGDQEGDVFSHEEIQGKLNPKGGKDEGTDDLDRDKPLPKDEEFRVEGGDDEWDKDQEGADLEISGEEGEGDKDKDKDKGVEGDDEGDKELSKQEKEDKQIMEDTIKYLSETEGGTKYIVKGREHDMRDLTPQEFKDRFSKAGRFYERAEEQAQREKVLVERERLAEIGARRSQEILSKYGEKETGKTKEVPELLKPSEDDTDSEKSLKEFSANLLNRVDKLETGLQRQNKDSRVTQLHSQLDSLQREFPMLSKSEVIAIKSMPEYADVDIRLIAENSHNERIGDAYLDAVFKTRPDKLREIEEKAIEKHLKKNPNVRKVSRKPSNKIASKKISEKKKKPGNWTFDKIEAHMDEIKAGLADLEYEED